MVAAAVYGMETKMNDAEFLILQNQARMLSMLAAILATTDSNIANYFIEKSVDYLDEINRYLSLYAKENNDEISE